MSHLMSTYSRLPITFSHGEGVWLFDSAGRRYLDALAGVAVNTLGHAHPKLVEALTRQVGRLIHTSNIFRIAEQEALGDKLCELSGMEEVFFCNSGCEANEAAIKLARLWGHGRGVELPAIVVADKAFHGRTLATLSATGSRRVQAGFEPLVQGFVRVPFDDIEAVNAVATRESNVVAVLVEPVQGEGGIRVAHLEFLRKLRALCDERGWLLMFDEVQCGMGRTGSWFAYQQAEILPDVVTLAKGLGSGVPIGACLAAGRATGTLKLGSHGSTFGGNPLACVAALSTLATIESEGLLDNARDVGGFLLTSLAEGLAGVSGVRAVRGSGLMIGVELSKPCAPIVARALDAGLLINVTADNVVRLLPPLIMTRSEARQLLDILVPLIKAYLAEQGS